MAKEISPLETQRIMIDETERFAEMEARHANLCEIFNGMGVDLDHMRAERVFEIIRGLGRGRQGVVVEAKHNGFMDCQTRHALKFFDPSLFAANRSYDVEMIRISRQVSVLQQLYHPNLVRCESFNEHHGIGVLVMELIEGLNIRSMLDESAHLALERRLPKEEWDYYNEVIFASDGHRIHADVALFIVRKMLRGLEVLHRTGYIHSDIKPSNVMIDRLGTVKLIDFGRATTIHDPGEQFLASPMYMAPELHRREQITPMADLYSCGLILLEMLHGGPVINVYSNETQIMEWKQNLPENIGDYLPRNLRRDRKLVKVLRKFLAVDLADRYSSAEDADLGTEGARIVCQRTAKSDPDTDYGLELENYFARRLPRSKVISRRKLKID